MSSKSRSRKPSTANTRKPGTAGIVWSAPAPVSESESTTHVRTDAEDKLWEALHTHPNSTAADLSVAAAIGKSTAQKILAKWAADGSVQRTTGIVEGGRRAADLWAITEVDTAPIDPASVGGPPVTDDATGTAHTKPEAPAAVAVVQDAPDAADDTLAEGDSTEPSDIVQTGTEQANAAPDDARDPVDTEATQPAAAERVVTEVSEPPDDGTATGVGTMTEPGAPAMGEKVARLAPGGLRGMVEDYLRDHPGEEFGPTAIANALGGKSSGAVSNALDKLVEEGTAVKTKDKPRRFALVQGEQVAAPAPTT